MSERDIQRSRYLTGRHPLRGFGRSTHDGPRVRGLTRGYTPSPASRVARSNQCAKLDGTA